MENNINKKIINLYEKNKYFQLYGLDFWIVIIFIILTLFLTTYFYILNHFQKVRQNWKNERCNPLYMPFAGMIVEGNGKLNMDYTSKNFKYCNDKYLKEAEKDVMEPIYFIINTIKDVFKDLKNAWKAISGIINLLKKKLAELFQLVVNKLIAILIPIQNIFIKIKDMVGKMIGTLVASIYTFYNVYNVVRLYLLNIIQITTTEVLIVTILALLAAIGLLIALLVTYFVMMALGASLMWFFGLGAAIQAAAQLIFWVVIIPLIIVIAIMLVFDILIWIILTLLNDFANEVYTDLNTKPMPNPKSSVKPNEIKTTSDKSTNPLKPNKNQSN